MSIILNIKFDKPQKVFMPDDRITGTVELIVNTVGNLSCLGLNLISVGTAEIFYRKTSKDDDGQEKIKEKTNSETYYNFSYFIWGDGISTLQLSAGVQSHPFSFILPKHSPSSFGFKKDSKKEHLSCGIHHLVKAVLVFPSNHNNIVHIEPISVIPLVDLNIHPVTSFNYKEPFSLSKKHSLWVCCCPLIRVGTMEFDMEFNVKGIVPGQIFSIKGTCNNKTLFNKAKSTFKLVQKVTCTFDPIDQVTETQEVILKEHDKIYPNEIDDWKCDFTVPQIPPSLVEADGKIIEIGYYLQFKLSPNGCHSTLSQKMMIPVGTVPFHYLFPNFEPCNRKGLLELDSDTTEDTLSPGQLKALEAQPQAPSAPNYFDSSLPQTSMPLIDQTVNLKSGSMFQPPKLPPSLISTTGTLLTPPSIDKLCGDTPTCPPSYNEATGVSEPQIGFNVPTPETGSTSRPNYPPHISFNRETLQRYSDLPSHEFKECHFGTYYYPDCIAYNVIGEEFAAGSCDKLNFAPMYVSYKSIPDSFS